MWLVTSRMGTGKSLAFFLQCTEASEVVVGLAVSVGGQYGFGYPLPQPLFQYRYENRKKENTIKKTYLSYI
jgi:hypothetical protein